MQKKGFTLVEILIVIFIFGVGILAILKLLTNSIGYFDAITMKTKASLLAKEGIEIVYNIRDSNIEQWYPWNFMEWTNWGETYIWDENYTTFKVGFSSGAQYYLFEPKKKEADFESNFKEFYLELFTGDNKKKTTTAYYQHTPQKDLPPKGFARIIEFNPISIWTGEIVDKNKIMKITSRVLYKRSSRTGEVVLESFIGMKDSLPAEKN